MNADKTEEMLISRSMPGLLPPDEGWIVPHYQGLSIANLAPTMGALLGVELPGALPPMPPDLWSGWRGGLKRVVLIVLDGLGTRLLRRQQAVGEGQVFSALASAGSEWVLTSVFPSTTDAALLSMASGRAPAEHGWLAYELYLRELGMVIDAILLCPVLSRRRDLLVEWGVDPEALVRVPMLAEALAARGIATRAVLPAYFRGSGFTRMLYRGAGRLLGYRDSSDMWVQIRHALAETRGQRAVITAYWGGLDSTGHYYGPDAAEWEAQFRSTDYLLGRELLAMLPDQDRDGTLLLITADHGQIAIPPEEIVTADQEAGLHPHLQSPISGESRAAFVYPRPGRAEAILEFLSTAYPEWFFVLDSRRALEEGLFGQPLVDATRARAGELLVLPRGSHALQRSRPTSRLVGRHGGLTPEEMLVPLIGARLEATPSRATWARQARAVGA